ncbi:uncharacterized protein LOC144175479 [Haemaphysalis longicornis]
MPALDIWNSNIMIGVLVVVVLVLAALVLLYLSRAKGTALQSSTDVTSTENSSSSPIPPSSSSVTSPPPFSATSSSTPQTTPAVLCDSEACQRAATQLLRGLSPESPPCDDFYRHVCGAWKRPPAYEADELFQKLVDDVAEESRAQTEIPSFGQTATQKAAMAYQACENIVAKKSTNMATVRLILEEAGMFPPESYDHPVDILNASFFLALTWRIASPFRIEFMRHTELGFTLRIGPSQSAVAYVRRREKLVWVARSKGDFKEMEATFQPDGEPKFSYDDWAVIDDVVTKEWRDILDADPPQTGLLGWNETTIYDSVPGMNQTDWDFLFSKYFNSPQALRFYVDSPALFLSFTNIPNLLGAKGAQAFYRWYMVEILACVVYAPWVIRLYADYESAVKHQRRFCFAIMEKSVGYAFLAPYVKKMFSTPVLGNIARMLRQVRGTYDTLFAHSEVFHPDTGLLPSYAVDSGQVFKLLLMPDLYTLEEHYANYEDMTEDPLVNWRRLRTGLTKSLYGKVTMNSAGDVIKSVQFFTIVDYKNDFILRPDVAALPFFDPGLPSQLKLAGVGSIMASAMVDILRTREFAGSLRDLAEWNKSHACMHHPGLPDWTPGQHDLLKRTVALAAIVSASKKSYDEDSLMALKDVPQLSGAQLLFAAWCHLMCGEEFGQQLCNEPLGELQSFFETFKCNASAKLRKTKICTAGWFKV